MSRTAGGVTLDTSDLERLGALLDAAARSAPVASDALLDVHGLRVLADATANAGSYTKASTGELRGAMFYERHQGVRRIGSNVRQAFFLEYGSPKTGAPDPWLSGPAERETEQMLASMAQVGGVW
jgi:hypothetical protein